MFFDLFIASSALYVGAVFFGHFERHTPVARRLFKLVFLLATTAALSATIGRPWSLLWIAFLMALGTTFHFWWTRKHGIDPLTAEPLAKYYALRGWPLPGEASGQ